MNRREMLTAFATSIIALPYIRMRSAEAQGRVSVKALVFDVFGTVVDWRSSIIAEGPVLAKGKNIKIDWAVFADRWRAAYAPSMDRVRKGELPWTKFDD